MKLKQDKPGRKHLKGSKGFGLNLGSYAFMTNQLCLPINTLVEIFSQRLAALIYSKWDSTKNGVREDQGKPQFLVQF